MYSILLCYLSCFVFASAITSQRSVELVLNFVFWIAWIFAKSTNLCAKYLRFLLLGLAWLGLLHSVCKFLHVPATLPLLLLLLRRVVVLYVEC